MTRKHLLLLLFFLPALVHAQCPAFLAERVIKEFVGNHPGVFAKNASAGLSLSFQTNGCNAYNLEGGGWIIVTGEDAECFIVAYSGSGELCEENLPFGLRNWLDDMYGKEESRKTEQHDRPSIAPLITSEWGQYRPYNLLTPLVQDPFNPDSPIEHAPTGCVVTAVAQIMHYYKWPQDSCHVYDSYRHLDFKTMFDWEQMRDSYTPEDSSAQAVAVASLMHDVGLVVRTNYYWRGSSAYEIDAAIRMVRFFEYSPSVKMVWQSDLSIVSWEDLLYNELHELRPVLLVGFSDGQGHAFICDGYDADGFFHINWGWDGRGDGYYRLTDLTPNITWGNYTFDFGNVAIIGIKKREDNEGALLDNLYCHLMLCNDSLWSRSCESADFPEFAVDILLSSFLGRSDAPLDCALALFRDNEIVKFLSFGIYDRDVAELRYYKAKFCADLPDGTYQLKLLWRHNNQEEWRLAQYAEENSVTFTIKGNYLWVGGMENMPTSVAAVPFHKLSSENVYDLQGHRLTTEPKRGAYIKGGKLWVKSGM